MGLFGLFSVPSKIVFFDITVKVIIKIKRNNNNFAKRNSSKLSMLRIVSPMNLMRITITSPKPSVNCSMPRTGPAVTSDENTIVRNVRIPPFLFMMMLEN